MIFLANLAGIGACPGPTEFESVMADMGEKVETKADKVNAPDDAPDETLAAQDTADSPEELDGETPTEALGTEEFSCEGAFP